MDCFLWLIAAFKTMKLDSSRTKFYDKCFKPNN